MGAYTFESLTETAFFQIGVGWGLTVHSVQHLKHTGRATNNAVSSRKKEETVAAYENV